MRALLWAVGTALGRSRDVGHRNLCALLFQRGLPPVARFSSPRAWAFTLLAIHEYLRAFAGDRVVSQMRDVLAGQLVGLFRANASPDWQWFERTATYDNAKLSHALILSGHWTSNGDMLQIGLSSLRWLLQAQTAEGGHFAPIGCHGFWSKGGTCARFDQQPLEAHAMVSACLEAYGLTGDEYWQSAARLCFEWFLGRNDLGQSLYDPETGRLPRCAAAGSPQSKPRRRIEPRLLPLPRRTHRVVAIPKTIVGSCAAWPFIHGGRSSPQQRAGPGSPIYSRRHAARRQYLGRAMSLTEAEIEEQLVAITEDFGSRHLDFGRVAPPFRARESARLQRTSPLRSAPALHRRAFLRRIRPRIRRPLQSFDRSPPRSNGLAEGDCASSSASAPPAKGHISSIEFRTRHHSRRLPGHLDEPSRFVTAPVSNPNPTYLKIRSSCTS